jgi:hypothetical protein
LSVREHGLAKVDSASHEFWVKLLISRRLFFSSFGPRLASYSG